MVILFASLLVHLSARILLTIPLHLKLFGWHCYSFGNLNLAAIDLGNLKKLTQVKTKL